MPAAWQSHPVVRDGAVEGDFVLPVALFIDAAKFGGQAAGRNKSIYNFTCVNLLSGRRHVIAVLRKFITCRCSPACKGWCTLQRLFEWARWSIDSLAQGVWPVCPFDGPDWDADADRAAKAGTPLGFRAAVLHLMCDWEAVGSILGTFTWSHITFPCPL